MKLLRATDRPAVTLAFLGIILVSLANSAPAQISVTSATPNSTTQGTINLNVTIGGKSFKAGATAQWFISGTTDGKYYGLEHGIHRRLRYRG
jgi:hypothetical protein